MNRLLATPPSGDPRNIHLLTSEISARIVKASAEELDEEIVHSLRQVLKPLHIDRGGLLEVLEGCPVVRVSHAWYDEGIAQVPREINLAEWFPWAYRQIVGEGRIMALGRCADLPADAAVDRQSFAALGNHSTLTIPLFVGGRIQYLITFDALRTERDWPDDVILQLRLLGEIFVSALQRRDSELALRQAQERFDLAAASADAGLWELDLGSGRLWMTDKTREIFAFAPGQEVTLEQFLAEVHGDDRGLITAAIEEACRTGQENSVEYRVPAVDGQVRWLNSRGRLQMRHSTGMGRLMGVTQEVTERKLLELRLQEQFREIEQLRQQLERENVYLREEVRLHFEHEQIIGESAAIKEVLAQVEQVAPSDATVLLLGETGTGKELVAQAIHQLSRRSGRVIVKVNCAALPAPLMESELFGRERGAYTGALSRQIGRFELAHGSTLLLDEVAELPLELQAKLLRVLETGEFERLGSPRTVKVDVRVIAATNRNLAEAVQKGVFREDLYYRLKVFPIEIPPLRERPEDIPLLVHAFAAEFAGKMGKRILSVPRRILAALQRYPWPGNIRELRNLIEQAVIVSRGEALQVNVPTLAAASALGSLTLEEAEYLHIMAVLERTGWRVKGSQGAAELLGLKPSTLYSRMGRLGIPVKRGKVDISSQG